MRVDIFKRKESDGFFSYLLVPEGKNLPSEVTNTDWAIETRGIDIDPDKEKLEIYSIPCPGKQIRNKGYAISNASFV